MTKGVESEIEGQDEKGARRLFKAMEREFLKGRLVRLDKARRISLADFMTEYLDSQGAASPGPAWPGRWRSSPIGVGPWMVQGAGIIWPGSMAKAPNKPGRAQGTA